jgi:hypothetical protein
MKLASKVVAPLAVIVSMVLTTAVPAYAAVVPLLVRDDPAKAEYGPAATATWVAWSDATVGRVYAQPRGVGPAPYRINPGGTYGYGSSPVTSSAPSEQITYQQVNSTQTRSDLFLFDLVTKVRTKLPLKVDSTYWEFGGVASTKYIFFNRLRGSWNYMLLFNRQSHVLTTVARFTAKCPQCYTPTWVGAAHAVYDKCSARTGACDPRVMTIGGATVAVPIGPAPVSAYGGSLDEANLNLYFIKSSVYCGIFVSIERANIASLGTQTDLYDTPTGIDLESTSLAPDIATPGDIDLLFTEFDCMGVDPGVYELNNVNTL